MKLGQFIACGRASVHAVCVEAVWCRLRWGLLVHADYGEGGCCTLAP